jgi:hypothetical protein
MPYGVARSRPRPVAPPPPAPRDVVADLKALAQLHEAGDLTDAEFAALKAKVLDADDVTS